MYFEKRSPIDKRDWIAEAIYPSSRDLNLPKTLDLRKELNLPWNQGNRGTCAAMTAAVIKEFQEKKDFGFQGRMSPEFVYAFRENPEEEGMYGRNLMKILTKIGICFNEDLPYIKTLEEYHKKDNDKFNKVVEALIPEAKKYIIKNYAQVTTIEGLKKALYKNGPCYISFPVYSNRPEMWRSVVGEKSEGGHAMAVVGYNKIGFIIQNSWGVNWNNNGCVIYPYEDFGMHWEIWTLVDEKSPVKDVPNQSLANLLRSCLFLCRNSS